MLLPGRLLAPGTKEAPHRNMQGKKTGARYEARTRDPDLGKVVLYQLS